MIYLDMDGVQADFNAGARRVLGMEPEEFEFNYGSELFWKMLRAEPDFYANLPPMLDVKFLWQAVEKYPTITLTALPSSFPEETDRQKRLWFKKHYPRMEVISVVGAVNKAIYAQKGDILIDDRIKIKEPWEKAGGVFIHHISAWDTLKQLEAMGIENSLVWYP